MRIIRDGKTKTLYADGDDKVRIVFKDDVTGTDEGYDPGGDVVVGRIEGKGMSVLKQTDYFFRLLSRHDLPTHYISSDFRRGWLTARKAQWLGLEFIVRFRAFGSFVRRYGNLVKEGFHLGTLVEITVKDDERGDPLIIDDALEALGILTVPQVDEGRQLVKKAARVIRDDLKSYGIELVDMKFECGFVDGRLVIIDDISTDNMRLLRDGKPVNHTELWRELGDGGP